LPVAISTYRTNRETLFSASNESHSCLEKASIITKRPPFGDLF